MIPAIAQALSSCTYRLDLPEPLTVSDHLLIDALTQRYEGVECPFLTFSRDGFTTIIYPRTIRGKIPQLGATTDHARSLKLFPMGSTV